MLSLLEMPSATLESNELFWIRAKQYRYRVTIPSVGPTELLDVALIICGDIQKATNALLSCENIGENFELRSTVDPHEALKVSFQSLTGQQFNLTVYKHTTVLRLKQLIRDEAWIPIDQQKLMLFQQPVSVPLDKDGALLGECGVVDGSAIMAYRSCSTRERETYPPPQFSTKNKQSLLSSGRRKLSSE